MKKSLRLHITVYLQMLVLLTIQFNTVGPQVVRLFPALAAGDFSECRCSINCHCSQDSRKKGECCCKKARKLQLKSHCASKKETNQEASIRCCPCGKSSQAAFFSPEIQVFTLKPSEVVAIVMSPGILMRPVEPPPYHDRRPEPPEPPPKLS